MTLPATTRRAGPFNGNGSTTSFPFTFKVFAVSDITVIKTSTGGVESTLTLNSDYSVTLNPDQDASPGGSITYPISGSALASGEKLSAIGALDYDQTLDLPSGGNFSPIALENALDRIEMQIQQVDESTGRALTLPVSSSSGVSTELPAPAGGKVIGWNSNGTALQNLDVNTLASVVAYGTANSDIFSGTGSQTVFTLSANPASVNNLDVSIGGVSQRPGYDYTWTTGTTVTFTSAPPVGTNNILIRYMQALAFGSAAASDVNYTPGGAGAVVSTVQSKLRERVSVKDFGALGDGVANDTTAFQQALNLGVAVFVPAGTYKITSTLIFKSGSKLYGVGAASILSNSMTSPGWLIEDTSFASPYTAVNDIAICDLTLVGNSYSSANSYSGISFYKVNNVLLSNVTVSGFSGTGIRASFCDASNNILVQNCTTNGTRAGDGFQASGQNIKYVNCYATDFGDTGFAVIGDGITLTRTSKNVSFVNCTAKGNYTSGSGETRAQLGFAVGPMNVDQFCDIKLIGCNVSYCYAGAWFVVFDGLTITGCTFDNMAATNTGNLRIDGVTNFSVTSCFIQSNLTSSDLTGSAIKLSSQRNTYGASNFDAPLNNGIISGNTIAGNLMSGIIFDFGTVYTSPAFTGTVNAVKIQGNSFTAATNAIYFKPAVSTPAAMKRAVICQNTYNGAGTFMNFLGTAAVYTGCNAFLNVIDLGTTVGGSGAPYLTPLDITSIPSNVAITPTSATAAGVTVKTPASYTGVNYASVSVSASSGWYHFVGQSSNATVNNIFILGNGNVTNTNNSYGAISDRKLKDIIGPAPSYWDKFKRYEFVNYTLKSDESKLKLLGLVAQQAQTVSSAVVEEMKDLGPDGDVLETTTLGVKYSVVTLQAEVVLQEAQRRIEDLEQRIAAMEARQ